VRIAIALIDGAELTHGLLFPRKGLHLADTGDILLQLGTDIPDRLPRLPVGPPDTAREISGRHYDNGKNRKSSNGEAPVQAHHGNDDTDQRQEHAQQTHQIRPEHIVDDLGITGQATHQVTGLMPVEKCQGQTMQFLEDLGAQPEQYPLAGSDHDPELDNIEAPGDQVHGSEQQHDGAKGCCRRG